MPLILLGSLGLASTANAADTCPNAKYRTGPSLNLPDCRAYELVTPPLKANEVAAWNGNLNPAQISADGKTILYLTGTGPTAQSAYSGTPTWERGVRDDEAGWDVSAAILPPLGPYIDPLDGVPNWLITNPQVDRFFFYASAIYDPEHQPFNGNPVRNGGAFVADATSATWVSRPTAAEPFPLQGTNTSPNHTNAYAFFFVPVGASRDLSTVYFTSPGILTPTDEGSGRSANESWATYKFKDGQLSSAGVLPDGTISPGGSIDAALAPKRPAGSIASPSKIDAERNDLNSVSTDGESFLFVSPDPARAAADPSLPKPQLYMAVEGEDTVLLSAPEGEDQPAAGSAGVKEATRSGGNGSEIGYAIATPDHSVVLFATTDALTDDAEEAAPGVAKTYRYQDDGSLTYLPELDGTGRVLVLADSGKTMLYEDADGTLKLWRDGQPSPTVISTGVTNVTGSSTARLVTHARLSSDEKVVLLNSSAQLRGEPDHAPPYMSGGPSHPTHVYRYDTSEDELDCVSCREGTPLSGKASFTLWGASNGLVQGSGSLNAYWSARGMSDDGSRVFFTSTDALLAEDHNSVNDVYQWEALGAGSCTIATEHGGCLSLISSGATGSRGERLYDTNADGSTVFISSAEQLVPADGDEYFDVYAVPINGGFDAPEPPTTDSGCTDDGCQNTSSSPPPPTDVGSGDVDQNGNVPTSTSPAIGVVKLKPVAGARARLRVQVPGPGRITISGKRVRRTSRQITEAGAYPVRIALKPGARRALKRMGRLDVNARVSYTTEDGKAVNKRVLLTFKRPKAPRSADGRRGR